MKSFFQNKIMCPIQNKIIPLFKKATGFEIWGLSHRPVGTQDYQDHFIQSEVGR